METSDYIREAIKKAGSEAKLGKATGYSQHAIWRAKKKGRVSPEMAVAIQRATEIPASKLRPDIFKPSNSLVPEASDSETEGANAASVEGAR